MIEFPGWKHCALNPISWLAAKSLTITFNLNGELYVSWVSVCVSCRFHICSCYFCDHHMKTYQTNLTKQLLFFFCPRLTPALDLALLCALVVTFKMSSPNGITGAASATHPIYTRFANSRNVPISAIDCVFDSQPIRKRQSLGLLDTDHGDTIYGLGSHFSATGRHDLGYSLRISTRFAGLDRIVGVGSESQTAKHAARVEVRADRRSIPRSAAPEESVARYKWDGAKGEDYLWVHFLISIFNLK